MLETELKKLTAAVEALTQQLQQVGITPETAPEVVPEEPEPTHVAEYTEADLFIIKEKTLALSRAGKREEIKATLDGYGVKKLTELSPEQMADFAEWVAMEEEELA